MNDMLTKRYGGNFYNQAQVRTILAEELQSTDLRDIENREYASTEVIALIIAGLNPIETALKKIRIEDRECYTYGEARVRLSRALEISISDAGDLLKREGLYHTSVVTTKILKALIIS